MRALAFLYSEFTGGVVDDYAFSCIYRHFRARQEQHRWELDRADAAVVDANPRRELSGTGVALRNISLLSVLLCRRHSDIRNGAANESLAMSISFAQEELFKL